MLLFRTGYQTASPTNVSYCSMQTSQAPVGANALYNVLLLNKIKQKPLNKNTYAFVT